MAIIMRYFHLSNPSPMLQVMLLLAIVIVVLVVLGREIDPLHKHFPALYYQLMMIRGYLWITIYR